MFKKLLTTTTIIASINAFAGEIGEKKSNDFNKGIDIKINDIFQFNEKIAQSICNETYFSKAPTLEHIANSKTNNDLYISIHNLSEDFAIRTLLGDERAGIWSNLLYTRFKSLEKDQQNSKDLIKQTKVQISKITCPILLNQPKLATYVIEEQAAFLNTYDNIQDANKNIVDVNSVKEFDAQMAKGKAIVTINDSEGRAANLNQNFPDSHLYKTSWSFVGWIEPFEITSIAVNGRKYSRIYNPVNNETTMIAVLTQNDFPLGFIHQLTTTPVTDFEALILASRTQEVRTKQLEAFKHIFGLAAIRALQNNVKTQDYVKSVQNEFIQRLNTIFLTQPQEEKTAVAELKRNLGEKTFSTLKNVRSNSNFVQLSVFYPDSRLSKLLKEFLEKLK